MSFPVTRPRRLRANATVRALVRETRIHPANLVAPLFVVPGSNVKREISSMPGQYNFSLDNLVEKCKQLSDLGCQSVLLFGIPEKKDDTGSAAWQSDGIIQRAIPAIKEAAPGMLVITDLCFCEYTSHGHCGIMEHGKLQNDKTLDIIVKQTVSHAQAGADIIAPSGMLDGCVGAMRAGLDKAGFQDTPIMAYSAKMASGFYGPFREAAQSAPQYGDRKSYQMDGANLHEALREVELDIEEGADIVMVKPASLFLDMIYAIKQRFQMPLAAYNVSGEYSMVKAAALNGWIDEKRIMLEMLTSIKRAGADIILTYFAEDYLKLWNAGAVE